jgi:hypothetical protein
MDKESLLQIAKQLNCEYEPGINCEINDFLECNNSVAKFDLKYHEKSFILNIILKNYKLVEVRHVFSALVRFIEYTSTFYVREECDNKVEYTLLSSLKSKKAFLCNITFIG